MRTYLICCWIILSNLIQVLVYIKNSQQQNYANNTLFKIRQILAQIQSLNSSRTAPSRYNATCNNPFINPSSYVDSLKYGLVQNSIFKNQCIFSTKLYDIPSKVDDYFNYRLDNSQKNNNILRKAFNKLFCKYDQEQDYIFSELQIISKIILKNDYYEEIYQDRNILHYKMVDVLNKNTNIYTDNLSKEHDFKNQENIKILQLILKRLQFNRFLKVDVKFDRLQFMVNYLNKHWLQKNPITVVVISQVSQISRISTSAYQGIIYYVPKENFCYFTIQQKNDSKNIEETIMKVLQQKNKQQKDLDTIIRGLEKLSLDKQK